MSDGDVTPEGEVPSRSEPASEEPAGKALRKGVRLPWPPPGLEWMQGKLWRVTTLAWIGGLVMVMPLLLSLGIEPEFWSLGLLEGNWELGLAIAGIGAAITLSSFMLLYATARYAGRGADQGYGFLTLAEVVCDVSRDTGFLLMGKRHFDRFTPGFRAALARRRLWSAVLILSGAFWLGIGFSLSVLMASRGMISPRETWLLTLGPSVIFLLIGGITYMTQSLKIRVARRWWVAEAGGAEHVQGEVSHWVEELDEASDTDFVMGGGAAQQGGRFRNVAILVALLFIVVFVPTMTIAVSSAVGPILAEIALPQFLSVQEMAGAAEALRRYSLAPSGVPNATEAGQALHNLEFVGSPIGAEEAYELPAARPYLDHWFPNPDVFPDIFSEGVGREIMLGANGGFGADEMAALRQAAAHPAQSEFTVLASANRIDMVATRWVTPFPDSVSMLTLPWPHFEELRFAALAHVSRAALEQAAGQRAAAERTVQEVITAGFLLVDNGPTLIDNLMGVVIANIGGDALAGLYELQGRNDDLQTLQWAREASANAARAARLGIPDDDIHTTLRGIPDIVVNPDALRGLRWEYFATFNLLSPCINLHKMVFGPGETYDDWVTDARRALVQVPGEAPLFDLAKAEGYGVESPGGLVPAILRLTLGSQTRPGSCMNLLTNIQTTSVIG